MSFFLYYSIACSTTVVRCVGMCITITFTEGGTALNMRSPPLRKRSAAALLPVAAAADVRLTKAIIFAGCPMRIMLVSVLCLWRRQWGSTSTGGRRVESIRTLSVLSLLWFCVDWQGFGFGYRIGMDPLWKLKTRFWRTRGRCLSAS